MTAIHLPVDFHGRVLRDSRVSVTGLESIVLREEKRHRIGGPGFATPERSINCIGG